MKLHWILMFVFCLVVIPVNAQDCGCDHVIGFDVDYIDGASFSPGDVVCVPAGTRTQIVFENLDGTLENPIQIVNCGGQVVINAPVSDFAIEFRNSFDLDAIGKIFTEVFAMGHFKGTNTIAEDVPVKHLLVDIAQQDTTSKLCKVGIALDK